MPRVAVIVGSLRRESIHLRPARALAQLATPALALDIVDLADVPLCNEDVWPAATLGVLGLKQAVEAADAVLCVTPEHHRALPALTKYMVDQGTRPAGQDVWAGKPAAIIGTSRGAIGTAVAQAPLRALPIGCGVPVMGQSEVDLQTKPGLIDDSFEVTDERSRGFLAGFVTKRAARIAPPGAGAA